MASYDFDAEELTKKAIEALKNSYSPYSKFPVGAALLAEDGRTFIRGKNVARGQLLQRYSVNSWMPAFAGYYGELEKCYAFFGCGLS